MGSNLWPQEFGFFQYLRLKSLAVLIRWIGFITDPFLRRRELALVVPGVRQEPITIPSREQGRFIPGDLYYPPGYSSSSPTPILVTWHGSGFVIPALGLDAYINSRIARETGMVVLDADYRKAPENPFPAALHDVEDTLRWIATQGQFDQHRIAVTGYSAGGNFALVAATTLRKKLSHLISIPIVISVYPETDLSIPAKDKKVAVPIKAIPAGILGFFNESYCPDDLVRRDPSVSPSFADPADFPETTVIITAEGDTLCSEADALAEKLKENGRKVVYHMFKDVGHGFDKSPQQGTLEWRQREELIELSAKLFKEAISL